MAPPSGSEEPAFRRVLICDTCGGEATPARVVAKLGDGSVLVDPLLDSNSLERVSVDFGELEVGDVLFVHDGRAIAKLR